MEDDQQFCLRWNNHQSTLIQNFDTLLESGTLVDCTLAAEGKTLKAHKVVLSACSPYFECLLSEHYDKHPVFILKDVKFKELKAMMDYMYRGEVNISQDQLAALLKAAESLQIKGLSESKTAGSSKAESRPQKTVSQPIARVSPSLDIPHASSGLTIEKNKVPRQSMAQGPVGDIPEDTASPQGPKRLCSREGSQSPTTRKRKRFRRGSLGEDNTLEMQDASNSSDMPQQMGVPALGITPVADEKVHADSTDSLGRSALMTQLTKPADEMLQLPLEKPEPNDSLIEPKSEYLEESEECVEDLTLDDDMNDLNDMEQDNNRAGPSHDPTQHPAGLGAWHVTGDRSNAGGVVDMLRGGAATGATDEIFVTPQEATAQQQRDSQEPCSTATAGPIVHVIPVRPFPIVFRRRTVWCGIIGLPIIARVAISDVSTATTSPSTAQMYTSTCEGFTKTCPSSSRNYNRNERDARDNVDREKFFYERKIFFLFALNEFMNVYYFCFNPEISDMYV
ncbi:protein jim lovell-like isoform X12 [Cataglyphis hispanica]|uniref:protein jim lovell-like isoform X12 n=1 Tax=Cataglyphis hispanica TaxID=1086592 RepID=UPI00218071A0|nr:protein jim lovell-like isoform X12 [Cataglyphis hispanica]